MLETAQKNNNALCSQASSVYGARQKVTPTDLLPSFSAMGVQPARGKLQVKKLRSGNKALDEFLDGGLPTASISEWGMPLGQRGRDVVLRFLSNTQPAPIDHEQPWTLWVYSRSYLKIYPPAWQARGVNLQTIRFARAKKPVAELKPIFMEKFFHTIILDAPAHFSADDCAFVARQARIHQQTVILLRDFFLGPKRGNVWAKLRLNCWYDPAARQHRLRVIRGLSPRQLALNSKSLASHQPASMGAHV